MIAKITHGWRPGGLLYYLLGPGRFNEHRDPRVIATWDGAPELHQPPRVLRDGKEVADMTELSAELSDPAVAAGIELREPLLATLTGGKMRRGPVWHCSLRNAAEDRVLTDAEWVEVIEDLLHRNGMAPRGDAGACRWVAVRHADDHVHVAVLRVRQDTGRKVSFGNDRYRARETCNAAEERLGLRPTSPADRTAPRHPTREELEKAARRGAEETSREWLRRAVRVAAVQARDTEQFFRRLGDLGVRCEPREFPSGRSGYVVAAPDDLDARGVPIWFGGSSLARDLSLPELIRRWQSAPPPTAAVPPAPREHAMVGRGERRAALQDAAEAGRAAAAALRTASADDAAAIGHAAGDLFTAVGALTHPGRPLEPWEPAELFDRATRRPGVGQPTFRDAGEGGRWPPVAAQLRTAAWRLIAVRTLTARDGTGQAELMVALAMLLAELAAWHEQHRQNAHAVASRRAGASMRAGGGGRPRTPLPHASAGARPRAPVAGTQPTGASGPAVARPGGRGTPPRSPGVRGGPDTGRGRSG